MMVEKPLIKQSLYILNVCGINPTNPSISSKIRCIVVATVYVEIGIENFLDVVFNSKTRVPLEGVIVFAMSYQIGIKLFIMVLRKNQLLELLHLMEQFWNLEELNAKFQHKLEKLQKLIRVLLVIFATLFLITLTSYLLKPIISKTRSLPFKTYHPRNLTKSPNYEIMYVLQVLKMIIGYISFVGFDCLFVSLNLYIIWEFKMLKHKFSMLPNDLESEDTKACMKELYLLIDHHNLILRCIKNMERICCMLLLNQFLSSIACICLGLLGVIINGFPPDLHHLAKHATFLIGLLLELFLYCIAGAYLMAESESVSQTIYEANWWVKTQPQLRRTFTLIIQRAQKTEKLSAGGMFILNLESFARVVRTALSFFTLVQALYAKIE